MTKLVLANTELQTPVGTGGIGTAAIWKATAVETWDTWNDRPEYWPVNTISTTSAATTWGYWNAHVMSILKQTLIGAVATNSSWVSWNTDWRVINETRNGYVSCNPLPETLEQIERRRRFQEELKASNERQRLRIEAENLEKERAKEKAEKLLLSALNPEQREELQSRGYFHCRSRTGTRYRIYRGSHGNVKRLDARGKEIEKLCVQPHYVPVGDCMLAQKLHIENDEDGFRNTANITRLN